MSIADDLDHLANEPLSREELERLLAIPTPDAALDEYRDLIRWFTKRYPTGRERLAYARKKWREHEKSRARLAARGER